MKLTIKVQLIMVLVFLAFIIFERHVDCEKKEVKIDLELKNQTHSL